MRDQSLKDSLARWNGFARYQRTIEPNLTKRAAAEAAKHLNDELQAKPADFDLKNLYLRVTRSWDRYRKLPYSNQVPPERLTWGSFFQQEAVGLNYNALHDLRRLPWILFYTPSQESSTSLESDSRTWLGADKIFVKHYGQWLSKSKSTRPIRTLLVEFLRTYPTQLDTFEELRGLLYSNITDVETLSLRKWRQRCDQFGLLEKDSSGLFVEKLVLHEEDKVEEVLTQAGFEGMLSRGRFFESGIFVFLPQVSKLLKSNELHSTQLTRFLKILVFDDGLRFDNRSVRVAIAESLLEPFVNANLAKEVREILEPFFLQYFGDPRLPSGKPNWIKVPEEFRQVVTRWLAEQALDAFFQVVRETALDHHWSYRQAFWKAYFKNHLIYDAWFVLGPRALHIMRSLPERETFSCGLLQGASRDQSVLLLRMHGATVAEWSHNGSCRVWLDGNTSAPELHREHNTPYRGDDLRSKSADLIQPHRGSEAARWQGAIARWLQNNIGAHVEYSDYFGRSESYEKITPLGSTNSQGSNEAGLRDTRKLLKKKRRWNFWDS